MERQSKHRILGILVIIGLVIILLPLFQDGKELSTQTTLTKTPPFPNQPLQDEAAISASVQDSSIPEPTPVTPQAAIEPKPSDDIMSVTRPSVVNTYEPNDGNNVQIQLSHNDVIKSEMEANKSKVTEQPSIINSDPVKTGNYRIIETADAHPLFKHPTHNDKLITTEDNGLLKLNSAVWVIQIGSFKNKTNALRIVNQLRANGYRAFIQQISTALGDNTRVFVGPEHKRSTARALADRLHSEMHIQAIVISYKPLTL